jgi:hypothetical protein
MHATEGCCVLGMGHGACDVETCVLPDAQGPTSSVISPVKTPPATRQQRESCQSTLRERGSRAQMCHAARGSEPPPALQRTSAQHTPVNSPSSCSLPVTSWTQFAFQSLNTSLPSRRTRQNVQMCAAALNVCSGKHGRPSGC